MNLSTLISTFTLISLIVGIIYTIIRMSGHDKVLKSHNDSLDKVMGNDIKHLDEDLKEIKLRLDKLEEHSNHSDNYLNNKLNDIDKRLSIIENNCKRNHNGK